MNKEVNELQSIESARISDPQREAAGREATRRRLEFLSVMLLATALRFYRLRAESLWVDEGYSLRDTAEKFAFSPERPIYFLILRWWMHFGHSEVWLRMPAVIFGIAAVALMYLLARRLFGHKVAILAALFMSVSTLHVNHSQEVRMYSLVALVVQAQAFFFIRFVETGRLRELILTLLLIVTAFLVHPLTILMVLVFNLYFVFRARATPATTIKWFASQGLACVGGLVLVPSLLKLSHNFGDAWSWGMARPGFADVTQVAGNFSLWQIPTHHHVAAFAGDIYGIFIAVMAVVGAGIAYRRFAWQTTLVSLWLVAPLIATALISNWLSNIWMVRYMIFASPALYMLTALAISEIRSGRLMWLALAFILALPIARLVVYYSHPHRPEWGPAVRYVDAHLAPGDSIAVYRYGYKYVFSYYYKGRAPWFAIGPTGLSRSAVTGWSDDRISRALSVLPRSPRTWFLLSCDNAGESLFDSYLHRKCRVISERDFTRVEVILVRVR
jgi:4-amino-4-deoxy-L-arabinose transferase-like glycosyltransferase